MTAGQMLTLCESSQRGKTIILKTIAAEACLIMGCRRPPRLEPRAGEVRNTLEPQAVSIMDQVLTTSSPPVQDPSVVAAAAYLGGCRVADIPVAEAGEWSRRPGHVVWIGLNEPTL